VITSAISPYILKFKTIGPLGMSGQIGESGSVSRGLYLAMLVRYIYYGSVFVSPFIRPSKAMVLYQDHENNAA